MGETQGPTKQLQFSVDGRVGLLLLPALGDVTLDRAEVDVHGPPVAEVVSDRLDVGQSRAERLDPTQPVVRHEIVQERTKLEPAVLGSRELLELLSVCGQLIELLAMEALGKLQIRGPGRD